MEARIKYLEDTVLELAKTVGHLQADIRKICSPPNNSFQWSESTILHEPKKVMDIQISESFLKDLDNSLEGFAFTTQEEMDAYVDSRRRWTFNIHYGALYYTRIFDNKAEADDFRTRLFKWRSGEI